MSQTDFQKLQIPPQQAEALVKKYYGLTVSARTLAGEVDFNYYLRSDDGKEFTLKISRPNANTEEIDFQAAMMAHLSEKQIPLDLPEIIPTPDKQFKVEISQDLGSQRWMRLQKWVPGRMVSDVNPRSSELLCSWGQAVGYLARGLQDFDHPAAHRFYAWNPSETLHSRKNRAYFTSDHEREMADYFWNFFETHALPKLSKLRKSVNYNDGHEHNLLSHGSVYPAKVTGIIDFGDALYTETINELAIACAYGCMYLPDPLEAATHVVRGFHQIFPLQESELEVLFPLITARLMITVASAAYNKFQEPDNEYLLISEKPAWDLLQKLKEISPDLAHFTFRNACGFSPHPHEKAFTQWLNSFSPKHSIVNFTGKTITRPDLSVGSLDLGNNENFEQIGPFQDTIQQILKTKGADFGIGGYGEIRPFYSTDAFTTIGNHGPQWRTVHLGVDVWTPAGTEVYAPIEGIIHSFQDNEGKCNYGPTIIVEHQTSEGLTFYTLYGHLSPDSLTDLQPGQKIKAGQKIARIGHSEHNGQWPPHLHFQIMLNMLNWNGDFPGAAFPEEANTWLSICPDPAALFPKIPQTGEFKNDQEILSNRRKYLGKSLSISYQKPLHIVRGFKQYLYDTTGRRYLDTVNNVPHVGHQHPRVVKAAQRQMAVLNTNTRYLHPNIVAFAEELVSTLPAPLSVVHFVNSGSEANELAMRMAYAWSGQRDMIAVEVGYHGNTHGAVSLSSYKFDGKGGNGAPETTQVVPIPDTYRGLYRDQQKAGYQYAAHVGQAIKNVQNKGRNIAGFICESILSCGGQIVLPQGYLAEAYSQVRAAGGLCIADEVQVGFGRVGTHFWGFELQDVVPDIVTMGKPIGNGHPLAAVVTTPEVAEAFANGMEYFNTFGGNPVSCAIGREVLAIIADEGLQTHALKTGNYLTQGLRELQSRYPVIGDVRGPGLFLGFELINDPETLEPAADKASYLANRMRQMGVLMSTDGPFHNILKIKPPMCFDQENAGFLLEYLDMVLREDIMME